MSVFRGNQGDGKMKMHLMLAVNNHRNGRHTGQVDQVEIDEPDLCLEGKSVSCSYTPGKLEIDGLHFNVIGYGNWAGNWCWDCAMLEHIHIPRIIEHLRSIGWSCTEAETSLFEAYHNDRPITAKMIEDLQCSPSP